MAMRRHEGYRRQLLGSGLIATALTLPVAMLCEPPFLWLSILWASVCFFWVRILGEGTARIIAFNAGAVLAILAAAETWFVFTDPVQQREESFEPADSFFVADADLGHRPLPDLRIAVSLSVGGEQSYAVTYTIDSDRLRVSGAPSPDDSAPCILFFGDSFTFGEGVEDDEAMPSLVSERLRDQYHVRNFGFSGYGPHQMLAALEVGIVERSAHCRPVHVVYWALTHHVVRVAGKWESDANGPRYVLAADGSVKRDGTFAEHAGWLGAAADESLLALAVQHRAPQESADVDLFFAVIAEARSLLQQRYPGVHFQVLYWDDNESPALRSGWERHRLEVHRLSDVFGAQALVDGSLSLPNDVHPTAATQTRVAQYVVDRILR